MSAIRRVLAISIATAAMIGAAVAPSSAVVGGHDASPGEYPSVAEITFGPFLCTGTLVTPDWVLTAGHCSSVTVRSSRRRPAGRRRSSTCASAA